MFNLNSEYHFVKSNVNLKNNILCKFIFRNLNVDLYDYSGGRGQLIKNIFYQNKGFAGIINKNMKSPQLIEVQCLCLCNVGIKYTMRGISKGSSVCRCGNDFCLLMSC